MNIILISGKAESGKDTFAMCLKEELEKKNYRVLIMHFADELKFYCQKYFGWDGKKDDAGRSLLQRIGTDVVRAKDDQYWVESVGRFLNMFDDQFDFVLIPDTRFLSEIRYFVSPWSDHITTTVRITRPDHKNGLSVEQQNHKSETELDSYEFDYQIRMREGLIWIPGEAGKFCKYYGF